MNRSQLQDRILTMVPEDEADRIMRWVDEYTTALGHQKKGTATWTAEQVAEFIGAKNAGAARSTLSRWGVESVGSRRAESGRMLSLYPAQEVREAYLLKSMKEVSQ